MTKRLAAIVIYDELYNLSWDDQKAQALRKAILALLCVRSWGAACKVMGVGELRNAG